jgi:DNA-binding transcriptional ArsR family regulator
MRILSLLTGTAMSAAEIARELDLTHANASYHLRQLAAADLVHLEEERSNRGGRERRYAYRPEWPRHPKDLEPEPDVEGRALMFRALADELVRRATDALPRIAMADAELWVDPDVWADVRTRVATAMRELHAAAQAPRASGTAHVSATVALFQMQS